MIADQQGQESGYDLILINGKVLTPFRVIPHGGVAIKGKAIERVFAMEELPAWEATRTIDVGGRVIAPGFIDLHLHGGGGADIMDDDREAVLKIAALHVRGGATAIVPSTMTSALPDLYRALDNVRYAKEKQAKHGYAGAKILGAHLEGPYFSAAQNGAQDARYLKHPVREEYERILDYSPDIIRVSAAPELEGALALGRELNRRGILASIGHTDATYDEVLRALEAGYRHVTHLYSGTSGVRRVNAYRVAGVIESALLLEALTVEIIADGSHLPASLIKLVYKCKGPEGIALITDALRAAGMPEGEYILGGAADGQRVIVEDGVAKLPDRSAFAGSVATMNVLVRNAVELGGIPLEAAVGMAASTPARIIGCDRTKGSLSAGKDADIVVFTEREIAVKMTIVEGQVVHDEMDRS